ncbi:positive regulator of sigma-B activity [Bacillus sp. SG-1]|nr:positive regulator of sigma-B activity [Bacillus sp. SG-1]
MNKGYSTSGSLGAGIPVLKTLMDDFSLETSPKSGTKITVVKWELL